MRQLGIWLRSQLDKLLAVPRYFRALAKEWMSILFGETLVGVVFLIWWALANPSNTQLIVVFVGAMFVAGFYAWHAANLRLEAKIKITRVCSREWEGTGQRRFHRVKAYYIEVLNKSEGITLEGVSIQLSGLSPPAPMWDFLPIPLHVQHDNPEKPENQARSFDLNPGELKNIDFVSAFEGDNRFSVVHVVAGVNCEVPFDTDGTRLQVRATAKNVPAVLAEFKVRRDEAGILQCEMEKRKNKN